VPHLGDGLITHHDFTPGGYYVASKNFEQRGFPSSILSCQSMDLPGPKLQVQIVQRAYPREITGQVSNRNRGETVHVIFSTLILKRGWLPSRNSGQTALRLSELH
jgi:hypothetical protein